jgi:hypothetical protein
MPTSEAPEVNNGGMKPSNDPRYARRGPRQPDTRGVDEILAAAPPHCRPVVDLYGYQGHGVEDATDGPLTRFLEEMGIVTYYEEQDGRLVETASDAPAPEGLALRLLQAARRAFREDDRAVMELLFDLAEAEQRQELRK